MKTAVITGFASGLGEKLAESLLRQNYQVVGLSRSGKSSGIKHKNFYAFTCDITNESEVKRVFSGIEKEVGSSSLLIHNAANLLLKDFTDIKQDEFEDVIRTTVLGGFLVTQAVLPNMLTKGEGVILYTGATASIKAGVKSGAFSAAKFALRGMAQSLARAYGKRGIHIIHTIIDGVIWGDRAEKFFGMDRKECIEVEALVDTYMSLIKQPKSCWTHEIDLRPSGENF